MTNYELMVKIRNDTLCKIEVLQKLLVERDKEIADEELEKEALLA